MSFWNGGSGSGSGYGAPGDGGNGDRFPRKNMYSTDGEPLPDFQYSDLSNMSQITPTIRQHLVRVYRLLARTVGAAGAGALLGHALGASNAVQRGLSSIALFVGFIPFIYIQYTRSAALQAQHQTDALIHRQRRLALTSFGFFEGVGISDLISHTFAIHPSILFNILILTSLLFTCFSMATYYSSSRLAMYAGSLALTVSSVILWLTFASNIVAFILPRFLSNLFTGSFTSEPSLIIMAILSCFFVMYHTQIMLINVSRGVRDEVMDALGLFQDIFTLFVRLLLLALKRAQERDSEQQQSDKRRKDR